MKRLLQTACMLLITIGLVSAAHAQLASYVDATGKLVFINGEPPKKAPEKNPSKATHSAMAGKQTALTEPDAAPGAPAAADANTTRPEGATNAPPAAGLNALGAASAAKDVPEDYEQAVKESAERHHVDPALVRAVISTESNWNPSAVSSKGAQGLMQIVPATAQTLGLGNPFDPKENIDAGVRYLSLLLARYNGDVNRALAAYNAGPGAVDRFGGVPNYRETRNYVQKVTSSYFQPGSARQPRAYDGPAHVSRTQPQSMGIYPTQDDSGRVIFVNE